MDRAEGYKRFYRLRKRFKVFADNKLEKELNEFLSAWLEWQAYEALNNEIAQDVINNVLEKHRSGRLSKYKRGNI